MGLPFLPISWQPEEGRGTPILTSWLLAFPRLCGPVTPASNLRPSMWAAEQRLLSPFLPETLILSHQTYVSVLPLGVEGAQLQAERRDLALH